MKLRMWQVDAFARKPFEGNPAAIVPLERWLSDAQMQATASENNLSETAFFVAKSPGHYDLRWFTSASEVALCGHATLASGWVVLNEISPALDKVCFQTMSGTLTVERAAGGVYRMSLPAEMPKPFAAPPGFARGLGEALGVRPPDELHIGRYLMAVWNDADTIRAITPGGDFVSLLRSVDMRDLIVTGKGDGKPYDCVSRFFAPDWGFFEDPVTGSARCALVPYWAKRLGKKEIRAYQASARGGELQCKDAGDSVILAGPCALYLKGEIEV
ncbi:MAG: PhzF family phenazine biosynthesis protein [Alphaproteobacteria bacterium]